MSIERLNYPVRFSLRVSYKCWFFYLWFMNPSHVIGLKRLKTHLVSLISCFSSKQTRYSVIIIQRYENPILEDMGDLITVLSSWGVFNPAIETSSCWFYLNHPGLLYIACINDQNHHQRTKFQQTHILTSKPDVLLSSKSINLSMENFFVSLCFPAPSELD